MERVDFKFKLTTDTDKNVSFITIERGMLSTKLELNKEQEERVTEILYIVSRLISNTPKERIIYISYPPHIVTMGDT